jgi:hypothetical protein
LELTVLRIIKDADPTRLTHELIGERVPCAVTTVNRAVRVLEAQGLIYRERGLWRSIRVGSALTGVDWSVRPVAAQGGDPAMVIRLPERLRSVPVCLKVDMGGETTPYYTIIPNIYFQPDAADLVRIRIGPIDED